MDPSPRADLPDQAQVSYCPHCGGDLTPGARRRRRPLSPERIPVNHFRGFRWWHVGLAVLAAVLVTLMLIRVLGARPGFIEPEYNGALRRAGSPAVPLVV